MRSAAFLATLALTLSLPGLANADRLGVTYDGDWPNACRLEITYRPKGDPFSNKIRSCELNSAKASNGSADCSVNSLRYLQNPESDVFVEIAGTERQKDACVVAGGILVDSVYSEGNGNRDFNIMRFHDNDDDATEICASAFFGGWSSTHRYFGDVRLGGIDYDLERFVDYRVQRALHSFRMTIRPGNQSGSDARPVEFCGIGSKPRICDYRSGSTKLLTALDLWIDASDANNIVQVTDVSSASHFSIGCYSGSSPAKSQMTLNIGPLQLKPHPDGRNVRMENHGTSTNGKLRHYLSEDGTWGFFVDSGQGWLLAGKSFDNWRLIRYWAKQGRHLFVLD